MEAEHDAFVLLTDSGGAVSISPHLVAVHVIPVRQGWACKAEVPPPPAQL